MGTTTRTGTNTLRSRGSALDYSNSANRSTSSPRGSNSARAGGNGSSSSPRQRRQTQAIANGLGWFSIGLGLAELVAPDEVAKFVGVKPTHTTRALLRVAGAREFAAGLGILSSRQPKGWVWARVAGDALDIAMLGGALSQTHVERTRLNSATLAVLGVTALDIVTGQRLTAQDHQGQMRPNGSTRQLSSSRQQSQSAPAGIDVKRAVTIWAPREAVYSFWRNFENLPRFMKHLESVKVTSGGRSHWKAKAPAGTTVEWDAEITSDTPNEQISWRSIGNADVMNQGTVRFVDAPYGTGTEVHVNLKYDPPAGALGALFAKLFGEEPSMQINQDLSRFKQVMELGEPMKSDASIVDGPQPGQPSGRAYKQ